MSLGPGALQREDLQLLDGQERLAAGHGLQYLLLADCGLPDGDAVLVHRGVSDVEVAVGLSDLGDLPHFDPAARLLADDVAVDVHVGPRRVLLAGDEADLGIVA